MSASCVVLSGGAQNFTPCKGASTRQARQLVIGPLLGFPLGHPCPSGPAQFLHLELPQPLRGGNFLTGKFMDYSRRGNRQVSRASGKLGLLLDLTGCHLV